MTLKQISIMNKKLNLVTLKNKNVELTLLDIGATVHSLKTKDKNGKLENIVLQYQDVGEYILNQPYFGSTVGRVAGRIKNSTISIDDSNYTFDANYQNKHTLHGGLNNLSIQQFDFEIIDDNKVRFTYTQKSTDDGFPGNLDITVTYELLENVVLISYHAISDKDTILNITNHNYYNLSGNYKTNILEHELTVPAKTFVQSDENLVPIAIAKIPQEMSFSEKVKISDKLATNYKEFSNGGVDHCYIVDGTVCLEDTQSGRQLKVSSSYPAMQIYTCNYPAGHILVNAKEQQKFDAICFEPQFVGAFDGDYTDHPMRLNKDNEYNHFIKLEF